MPLGVTHVTIANGVAVIADGRSARRPQPHTSVKSAIASSEGGTVNSHKGLLMPGTKRHRRPALLLFSALGLLSQAAIF
jgi:hypothetical protein